VFCSPIFYSSSILVECNQWIAEQGLPEGELQYDLTDGNNQSIAMLDLAWPNGLQEGLSQPVALLIDEGMETEEAANSQGFRYFTDVDEFKDYVVDEVLGLENDSIQDTTLKCRRNSIRGTVIRAWIEAGKPDWDLDKTLEICISADEKFSERGINPAPKFRDAVQRNDRHYLRQWAGTSRFEWL